MSFEGYYVWLCGSGHRFTSDVYDEPPFSFGEWDDREDPERKWRCSYCKAPMVWWELVSTTNEEDNSPTQLHQIESPTVCICEACGHEHYSAPARYAVPTTNSNKVM